MGKAWFTKWGRPGLQNGEGPVYKMGKAWFMSPIVQVLRQKCFTVYNFTEPTSHELTMPMFDRENVPPLMSAGGM